MNDVKTYIFADNYRGFSRACLPLRQVNYFVGENSTGKSSIIDLIEVLSHFSFWVIEPEFGNSRTPDIAAKHFTDLVSASSASKKEFTIGGLEFDNSKAANHYGMLVTYTNKNGRPHPSRVSVLERNKMRSYDGLYKDTGKSTTTKKLKIREGEPNGAFEGITSDKLAKAFLDGHFSEEGFIPCIIKGKLPPDAPFFMLLQMVPFEANPKIDTSKLSLRMPSFFQQKLYGLAPIRTKPKRTYDEPQTKYSVEGHHIPYSISAHLAKKSTAKEFKEFLEKTGSESHLFDGLKVKKFGKGERAPFELNVVLRDIGLTLDNVGYGVSQALPIIVEMFVRDKKSLFSIQQPEVHLHPRAQATMGGLVADLARHQDKRFVIETHSDFMIDRFRLNIRQKGEIDSQLLFFERTENGNEVCSIPINSDGSLPDDQPNSYREFFFNESIALLS